MSPVTAVSPVSDLVRDEIIALLAEPAGSTQPVADARLNLDPLEIAQEQAEDAEEDEVALLRISPVVPL
jgi:hypothetical protein